MAAGGITAAAVWVDVVPSLRNAARNISRDARQLGQNTGKAIVEETSRTISQRAAAIGNAISRTFTRVQQAAVSAGQRIGRAFSGGIDAARAALGRFMTGWSALDAETARAAGRLGRFGAAARSAFDTAARPLHNFIGGFSSAEAAASALTGRLGTLGGRARQAFDVATRPLTDFVAGFRSADAAASAFTGRMGSLGGATRSALNTAAAPLQNFVSGFRSSAAAASAFTGRIGSLGGATRTALTSAAAPLQNFVSGFRSSDAAASAFTGSMGTLGGATRSALTAAAAPLQNFTAGFRSSDAAASAFTGSMGSLGGTVRSALTTAAQPLRNFTSGFQNSSAAASAFSGRMGTVGGAVRSAMTSASSAFSNFAATVNQRAAETSNAISNGIGGALFGLSARAVGATAAAVAIGTVGTASFGAAANIQNTELTLTGLYGSAEKAGDMMGRLRDLSSGSPIEYAAYAQAATSLAYMGFEGQQAEQVLRNVGAAITAAGGSSAGMERATGAMLQMVNSGRVYAAQLSQISDAGVPIFSALSHHFFQTTDRIGEVREMVTKGAVSIEDVMAAVENASGSTFQSMLGANEQVSGSMSNQWKIFQNNVVTGFGQMLAPMTGAIAPMIGSIGKAVGDGMARIPGILAGIRDSDWFTNLTAGLRAVWEFLQPVVEFLLRTAAAIAVAAWPVFTTVLGAIGSALSTIMPYLRPLQPIIVGIAAAFAVWWAVGAAVSSVVTTLALLKNALGLVTGAWKVLSLAFTASPIGFIIALVAGLVLAVIYAWNNFEGFRNVVIAVWDAIKSAAASAWSFLQGVWDGLTGAVAAVIDWFAGIPAAIGSFFTAIGDFFAAIGGFFTALPGRAAAGLSAMGAAVGEFMVNLPSMIAHGLGVAVGAIIRWGVEVYIAVVTGFNATMAWLRMLPFRLFAFAVSAWAQFTAGIKSAFNATVDFFVALPGRVVAFLLGLGATLYSTAVVAWAQFTAGVDSAWDATVAWFVALPARVAAFVIGVGVALAAAAVAAWNGFTTGVQRGWLGTIAFFVTLPARIGAFFSNVGTWLLNTGADLIAGLILGVAKAWAGFLSWIDGLIASFLGGFKQGLGIASPSTIFAEIGGWLIQGLINGIRAAGALLWSAITAVAQGVVNFFMAGIAVLQERWNAVWNSISTLFATVWNTIRGVVATVWGWIVAYFQTSLAAYQVMWSNIWGGISSFFTGIWNWIRTTALTVWAAIVAYFQAGFAYYRTLFTTVWNAISAVFTTVWNWIRTTATTVWNNIVAFFTGAFATFTAFFTNVWNNILAFFRNIWNWLRDTAVSVWNWLSFWFQVALVAYQTMWSNIWNAILSFFRNIWTWLRDTAVNAWNAIRAWFDTAFAAFTTFFRDTWNNIVDTFSRIWSGITDIAKNVWERVRGAFRDGVNGVIRLINRFADAINKVAGMLGFDINLHINELADGGPVSSAAAGRAGTSLARARQAGGPIGLASGGVVNAATGGMLPGRHSPGRDRLPALAGGIQHYRLDGGEYVVQRDSTRSIGAAGMAAINNARRRPVDVIPRAKGGPVLPEPVVRQRYPFLSALASGQAEAVGAAAVFGGAEKLLGQLAVGNSKAERATGKPGRTMQGYRRQFSPGMLDPIGRDLGGAIRFARSMSGKPYIWGGGTTAGTDCSGYQGMITSVLRNQPPRRIGTTGTFPWAGFRNGLGSQYAIGSFKGNPGHMAGTLAGVNVESGGSPSRVKYGAGAVGADHRQFSTRAHLPEVGGVFASGGAGGGWVQELIRPVVEGLLKPVRDAITPIRDNPASGFGKRTVAGAGVKILDWMIAKADQVDAAGGMDVSGISGPVVDQVRQVAARFGWDRGPEWDAIAKIVAKESSWDPNAANSRSSARGLFQKMTSLHGPVEPTPAGQAQWGLNYIRGRYVTPTRAWAHHQRVGSYDRGGYAIGRGVMFKDVIKPEMMLDPVETEYGYRPLASLAQRLDAGVLRVRMDDSGADVEQPGSRDDRPVIENLYVTAPDRSTPEELAQAVTWEVRRVRRGGVYTR